MNGPDRAGALRHAARELAAARRTGRPVPPSWSEFRNQERLGQARRMESYGQVVIHAHNNLSLAVANSLANPEEGADTTDGCTTGLGAGAGTCTTELLVGAAERHDVPLADIILELGRRRVVGGQEDMIVDVAVQLAAGADAA